MEAAMFPLFTFLSLLSSFCKNGWIPQGDIIMCKDMIIIPQSGIKQEPA